MPRKKNSLKHDIFVNATKNVTNNTSRTSYKRSATRFAKWAKVNGIKKISDITEEVLQAYHDDLKNDPKGYTAATIHTYLAPICKAAGINLNRIRKQKNTFRNRRQCVLISIANFNHKNNSRGNTHFRELYT